MYEFNTTQILIYHKAATRNEIRPTDVNLLRESGSRAYNREQKYQHFHLCYTHNEATLRFNNKIITHYYLTQIKVLLYDYILAKYMFSLFVNIQLPSTIFYIKVTHSLSFPKLPFIMADDVFANRGDLISAWGTPATRLHAVVKMSI